MNARTRQRRIATFVPILFLLTMSAIGFGKVFVSRTAMRSAENGKKSLDAKDYQAAITQLEASIELKPAYFPSHNDLGIALYSIGRTEEAIDELRESIRLDSNYTPAHFYLGEALVKQHRLDEARHEFELSIEDTDLTRWNQRVRDEIKKLK